MKPTLPNSDAFYCLAAGFLDAATAAHGRIRSGTYVGLMWLPCAFLCFRAIELALKAALASHGVSEHEINLASLERRSVFRISISLGKQACDRVRANF
jgi:hypothetical protein